MKIDNTTLTEWHPKGTLATIVQDVQNGEIEPKYALVYLRKLSKAIEDAESKIKDQAIESIRTEIEGSPNKIAIIGGLECRITEGRKTYKFDHINEWVQTNARLKAIEHEAKVAADLHAKGKDFVDEDSGLIVTPAVVNHGNPFVTITPQRLKP